jgi:hypothetical protein
MANRAGNNMAEIRLIDNDQLSRLYEAVGGGSNERENVAAIKRYEVLLHNSTEGRASSFAGKTHAMRCVTGVPTAVKRLSTATRM